MRTRTVQEIMLPFRPGIPLHPCVSADDRITEAIRRMLACDVYWIAVTRNNRPIGVIRLKDALKTVGLDVKH